MVSHLLYSQLALLALLWLFVMVPLSCPRRSATSPPMPATPLKPKRQRAAKEASAAEAAEEASAPEVEAGVVEERAEPEGESES